VAATAECNVSRQDSRDSSTPRDVLVEEIANPSRAIAQTFRPPESTWRRRPGHQTDKVWGLGFSLLS
jgi:hypothetical protein